MRKAIKMARFRRDSGDMSPILAVFRRLLSLKPCMQHASDQKRA